MSVFIALLTTMTAKAAARGDTEGMLKIGKEKGWDPETTWAAASEGHTQTMIAAVNAGCGWDTADVSPSSGRNFQLPGTIGIAILSGYPETAEAARRAGCPE